MIGINIEACTRHTHGPNPNSMSGLPPQAKKLSANKQRREKKVREHILYIDILHLYFFFVKFELVFTMQLIL